MEAVTVPAHVDAAYAVVLIVSFVLPVLAALLARAHWPGWVVGLLTLLLAALNGFFGDWAAQGDKFQLWHAVLVWVLSYVVAVAARYGVWKEPNLDSKLLSVGSKRTKAAVGARARSGT